MPHHGCGWVKVPSTHMHAKNTLQMDDSIGHPLCLTYVSVCVCMCMAIPLHIYTPTHPSPDPGWFKSLKWKKSWTNWDNLILFEDIWDVYVCVDWWLGGWGVSCQITENGINLKQIETIWFFLGGLSLPLNHLIASRMANYDWPFGTLPFGLFWSNLDTRDLETYPRTYSGHFWNMSIFDDSRAVWVLFRK